MAFIRFHFADRDSIQEKVLLLWDDFSGHWTQEVTDYAASINVVLLKVPPRYTFVCQPADVAWIRPFKDLLRNQWMDYIHEQVSRHHADERRQMDAATLSDTTSQRGGAPFALQVPKRTHIASWIATCWKSITPSIIIAGFRKVGILTDTRPEPQAPAVTDSDFTDLVAFLEGLQALGEVIDTDDDLSSEESDSGSLSEEYI